MTRTRLLRIEPNQKTLSYWYPETEEDIFDFMGNTMRRIITFGNKDVLIANTDPFNIFQNFFVCFDWKTEAFPPLKIYGPSFICGGEHLEETNEPWVSFKDVDMPLQVSRFFITFPILKDGFIFGVQN